MAEDISPVQKHPTVLGSPAWGAPIAPEASGVLGYLPPTALPTAPRGPIAPLHPKRPSTAAWVLGPRGSPTWPEALSSVGMLMLHDKVLLSPTTVPNTAQAPHCRRSRDPMVLETAKLFL